MMDPASARRALFAACRRLGMDEGDRHAMLLAVTGRESSKDLSPREWAKVLDHLNRLTGHTSHAAPTWRRGCEALGGKVAALMAAQKLPWRYLTHGANGKPSMLKRLAGVDRLEFADADGLRALIAALARRAAKADVAQAAPPARSSDCRADAP